MNKIVFLFDLKNFRRGLMVLSILMIPLIVNAGDFYKCRDQYGNESLIDFPIEGQTCAPINTYEETSGHPRDNKPIVSANDRTTKIIVRGNQVLIPVKIAYDRRETSIYLLMDTGASGTAIHSNIADQLYINLYKAQKAKAGIVGGGMIDASIVMVDSLQIGPHIIKNCNVAFIPHEGRTVNFDGLLGMDVLGRFGYKIDLTKQTITWE